MQRKVQFDHKGFNISYTVCGSGKKAMLFFHGFAQDSATFSSLFNQDKFKDYTIYSVALFFHESTIPRIRKADLPMTKTEFMEIISALCERESIGRFSLMAYSIGCRLALTLFSEIPERIEKVVLLAPDGIQSSLWYKFLVHTVFGKFLFKWSVKQRKGFGKVVSVLRKLRLISDFKYKLGHRTLADDGTISKVWNTWMFYSQIQVGKTRLIKLLNDHDDQVMLFYGNYDKIIRPVSTDFFKPSLIRTMEIHLLETGHNFLPEKIIKEIAEKIL